MSNDNIFRAKAIQIGSCGSPTCKNVHLQLLDANNEVHAVALIHYEELYTVLMEMTEVAIEMERRDLLAIEPQGSTH